MSYRLLNPELVKHLLYLQFPVVLQRVEGLGWHLEKAGFLDGRKLKQDCAELRATVRVWTPAG